MFRLNRWATEQSNNTFCMLGVVENNESPIEIVFVASSRWSSIDCIWQTLIVSTQMWCDLPKCTSQHQTSVATIVRCRLNVSDQLTHFGICCFYLFSILSIFGEIKDQMKTSKNAFGGFWGLIYIQCEGVLHAFGFVGFHDRKIHLSSMFSVVRARLEKQEFMSFLLSLSWKKNTERKKIKKTTR